MSNLKTVSIEPQAHTEFMKICEKNKRNAKAQFEVILDHYKTCKRVGSI